ncbi:MAG: hypothetical protein ACXV46_07975 [Halobacteriota archaeon]
MAAHSVLVAVGRRNGPSGIERPNTLGHDRALAHSSFYNVTRHTHIQLRRD